jgi:hypothetical protein
LPKKIFTHESGYSKLRLLAKTTEKNSAPIKD